jgi:hypothetical protein
LAGDAIAVIDYNGKLRVCELRDAIVDLAEYDYNFEAARRSPVIQEESKIARSHQCDCTHVCFINTSVRFSLKQRFLALPWYYWRYRLSGRW